MRFRLLAGKHQTGTGRHGNNDLKNYAAYRNGKPRTDTRTGEELLDVIETTIDLAARFGAEKFELLPDLQTAKGK